MYLLDANVLIAAWMDGHVHHEPCKRWLAAAVANEDVALCDPVILAFLRVTTSHRVFEQPLAFASALTIIDDLVSHPSCSVVHAGRDHRLILRGLADATAVRGDVVPDAWIAALAIEQGATLVSLDADFARFPEVRTLRPGAA